VDIDDAHCELRAFVTKLSLPELQGHLPKKAEGRALLQGRLDFPDLGTNYGYMNATKKIRRDFLFRVCPIAGS
jgi:hypothetical protein